MGKSKKYNNKYTKDKNIDDDGFKIKQVNKRKQRENNKLKYKDYIEEFDDHLLNNQINKLDNDDENNE